MNSNFTQVQENYNASFLAFETNLLTFKWDVFIDGDTVGSESFYLDLGGIVDLAMVRGPPHGPGALQHVYLVHSFTTTAQSVPLLSQWDAFYNTTFSYNNPHW